MTTRTRLEECPRCRRMQPNVGPWKGGEFQRLCGTCKIYVSLSEPGFGKRLGEALGADKVIIDLSHDPARGGGA